MAGQRDMHEEAIKITTGLYPHQADGVALLMGRRRAILADDMGFGKTHQAIVAASHLEPVCPYLVVCPASVKQNWMRTGQHATHRRRSRLASGTGTSREANRE